MSAGQPWCKFATRAPTVATKAVRQYKLPLMSVDKENYPLLQSIDSPADLRRLPAAKLRNWPRNCANS
jgi:hypothetical protein